MQAVVYRSRDSRASNAVDSLHGLLVKTLRQSASASSGSRAPFFPKDASARAHPRHSRSTMRRRHECYGARRLPAAGRFIENGFCDAPERA
jgi:hypothetical protein